jgi:CRP/FNR family transcriptional regulator
MDGREQTLTILKMGDGFNLPAAFSSDHLSPASAASFGNSKVILINQANFRGLVKELPDFSLAILNDLSDKLIHLTNLVHEVSLMSVRGRLAKFLLVEFEKKGTPPTRWTQEQIAARLGTRREVLSRSLRELVEDGLVRTERQKIIIIDAERLKEEAGI